MSNYTVTTNFLSKDALISGNPLKLVKGADLTVEFNNIATAVNSKYDSATALTTGTFTGTLTGMVGATTATCTYSIVGNIATITTPSGFNGTSNSTSMQMTGLPAAIQPLTLGSIVACNVVDNSGNSVGAVQVQAGSGSLTFYRSNVVGSVVQLLSTAFTNTGVKGLNVLSFSYCLL